MPPALSQLGLMSAVIKGTLVFKNLKSNKTPPERLCFSYSVSEGRYRAHCHTCRGVLDAHWQQQLPHLDSRLSTRVSCSAPAVPPPFSSPLPPHVPCSPDQSVLSQRWLCARGGIEHGGGLGVYFKKQRRHPGLSLYFRFRIWNCVSLPTLKQAAPCPRDGRPRGGC